MVPLPPLLLPGTLGAPFWLLTGKQGPGQLRCRGLAWLRAGCQQEAERELLWAAQRACCWEVGSCLFSRLLAACWGLRCWGQSLGAELAWLEKTHSPSLSQSS